MAQPFAPWLRKSPKRLTNIPVVTDTSRVRASWGNHQCARRAIVRAVVVLAIGILPVLPAAAHAAIPADRAATKAAARPAATGKASRATTRAIRCAATVSSTRRLTPAQRAQVRRLGAYRAVRTVRTKGSKRARRTVIWICVRTTKQAKVVRSLTRSLGRVTSDRTAQSVSFPATLDGELKISLPEGDDAGWRMLGAP